MQTNADESSPPIFFFAQHFSQIFSWIPENRWGAGSKYIFKSDILFLIRRGVCYNDEPGTEELFNKELS